MVISLIILQLSLFVFSIISPVCQFGFAILNNTAFACLFAHCNLHFPSSPICWSPIQLSETEDKIIIIHNTYPMRVQKGWGKKCISCNTSSPRARACTQHPTQLQFRIFYPCSPFYLAVISCLKDRLRFKNAGFIYYLRTQSTNSRHVDNPL